MRNFIDVRRSGLALLLEPLFSNKSKADREKHIAQVLCAS
jgi:hypothetical protein